MQTIKNANVAHVWTILCQSATIDTVSNDLTLIKTIDELSATFPNADALSAFQEAAAKDPVGAPMSCELVTLWKKTDRTKEASFDMRVSYRNPEGKILSTTDIPTVMEPGKFRHRNRLNIPVVPMTGPGEYFFVIEAKANEDKKYELVTEIPLDIVFQLEQKPVAAK